MSRTPKVAKEGYVYTDGITFGKKVYVADGINPKTFYEITEEEAQKIQEERESANELLSYNS